MPTKITSIHLQYILSLSCLLLTLKTILLEFANTFLILTMTQAILASLKYRSNMRKATQPFFWADSSSNSKCATKFQQIKRLEPFESKPR